MKTISLKVPDGLHTKLERTARQQGQSKSDVVRSALEQFLNGERRAAPVSFLEAAGDLIGCVEGPGDLSTNPKHLEGYGQ